MARLEKLCIRGVRSYGPFDDDEQCVSFMSPITLIMGQNGSGKTTVIEALKYATTGDAPPGSMRGQSFIHDPKLSAVSEVHAMIKLVFKDCENQEWTVTRRMRLIQKLKKTEFKTLELMISRIEKDGSKKDYRGRCVNENFILAAALGVSKPILNHVIFCHQEDSCWPLDEAKTLKEKFDAIFDITKYNKCIETIRKLGKKIEDELKVLNNQLQNDKIHKKQAEDTRRSLREAEERHSDTVKKIENFDKDLEQVRKDLEEVNRIEHNIVKLQNERDIKKRQLESVKQQQNELRQTIKKEFPGSTRELYQAMEEFREQLFEKETELTQLEAKMLGMKAEEKEMLSTISQKHLHIARMEAEERQQQERVDSRNDNLAELAQQLAVPKPEPPEVMDMAEVMMEVTRKVSLLKEHLDALREQLECEEQHFQSKIDGCREEVARLNQEIRMKREQLNVKKSEERKAARQIAGVKISDADAEKVDNELDGVNMDLEVAVSMHDSEDWDSNIAGLVEQRTEFEKKLRAVDQRVIDLQSQSNLLAEIKVMEKSKAEKEERIKDLENTLQRPMMFIFKEFPAANLMQCVDHVLSKCENSIREKTKLMNSKQKDVSVLEYKQKEQEAKLSSMEEEVLRHKDSIIEHCGSEDLETSLKALQKEMQELQDEKGVLSSSELMYRHFIEKMQQDEPCCPLCHRSFQEQTSVEELIFELTGKMSEVPTLVRAKEDRLELLQKKYDALLQLKPAHQKCHRLITVDIPAARSVQEETGKKLEQMRIAEEEMRKVLTELQTREKVAKGALGDVLQLDQLRTEVAQVEKQRAGMVSSVAEDPAQSLQSVLNEQSQLRSDMDATNKELENTRTRFNSSKDEINRLRDRKNQLATKHLKIQGDLQMRRQWEEKREECEKEIAALSVETSDLSEKLEPANKQLETAIESKKELQAANRKKLDTKRTEVNGCQKRLDEVEKLQRTIDSYEQRCMSEKLELAKETVHELERSRKEHELRMQGVASNVDELKNYLATQKIQERELQDNLKLRDKQEEEKELADEISEVGNKIGAINVKAVQLRRRQLDVKHSTVLTERAHSGGQQKELEKTIEHLQNELNTPALKDAEDKFNETSFTIKADELAKEDLRNYSLAMEWAVTHFHTERMKIINTIIRNLWRQIYCGTDIDYIEIKTSSDVKSTLKRRSYTYKVVQVKSGVEMDMRGRCSGGQKILASLIIRIALAETFSSKCVFLALDEPTANLDRENINNFVHALADIVRTRSSRGKFQLIIITHDQQFLEMLNELHLATEYFHVGRNERARSVIKKQCVRL